MCVFKPDFFVFFDQMLIFTEKKKVCSALTVKSRIASVFARLILDIVVFVQCLT